MGLNKVQEEGLLHACFLDQYLELIENYRYTSVQLAGKIKPARI
jgi:hypothetical protein